MTIKTRGPLAFARFLASLRQSNHEDLADILEGTKTPLPITNTQSYGNHNECTKESNVEETTFIPIAEG